MAYNTVSAPLGPGVFRQEQILKKWCAVMVKRTFHSINQLHLPNIDTFEEVGNVRIMRFKGVLDSRMVPEILKIKKQLEKIGDSNRHNVLIDFKKVTSVDSAAIAVLLIKLAELKRHDKKLGLIHVNKQLKTLLDIFKTGELFVIFDSEEAAMESFSRPSHEDGDGVNLLT
jgi:anti-anti-sigma factor